jgi:nitrate reductase gamma subunit
VFLIITSHVTRKRGIVRATITLDDGVVRLYITLGRRSLLLVFQTPEDSICISQRSFAIGICIAGLILMLCVIAAILCLLARRRTKKTMSNPGSSIYSGPYTNTAYSHSS